VRAWLRAVVNGRMLELAIAVSLGYAIAKLADQIVSVPVLALAQHVTEDPYGDLGVEHLFTVGLYRLNFNVGGTVIFYGEVVAALLVLCLMLLAALLIVRRRERELGVCPLCASRIPYESTHCAYCGSGVASSKA